MTSTLRVIWLMASTTLGGFVVALVLFTGYAMGFGFLFTAAIATVFPDWVGLITANDIPQGFGTRTPAPGVDIHGGWWVVPLSLIIGLAVLVITQKGARAWQCWIRNRIRTKEFL